ncbi:MAG: hypothetical protein ACI8P9_002870 [Parasphingorhabdus sp.]|jgi:hypothetical protein
MRKPSSDQDTEPGLADGEERFLSRWSRRKLDPQPLEVSEENPPEDNLLEEQIIAEPVLTDADMPALDTITEDSNVSAFLSSGVSQELRNKALRKMFVSAAFNVRDGLDEYDDDFTKFEKLGDIVTADMRHQMEMEQERLERKARELAEQDLEENNQSDTETPSDMADSMAETDETPETDNKSEDQEEDQTLPANLPDQEQPA